MQNISIPHIIDTGSLAIPYAPNILQGFLDLPDLGRIAAKILLSPTPSDHSFARYELTGSNATYEEVARVISEVSGKDVRCVKVGPGELEKRKGLGSEWAKETLRMMLEYYQERYVPEIWCLPNLAVD